MPSPFPAIDPYLEQPSFWPSFHSWLFVAMAEVLGPKLRPHYYIEVEFCTNSDDGGDGLLVDLGQ
jgi:hypothetical protein